MRVLAILFIGVFLMAGSADAVAAWSNQLWANATSGRHVSTLTPDANTQTATLRTHRCESITVTCYGTNMTGLVQMCNAGYAQAASIDSTTCQNMNETALDCAATHSVQIEPSPAWLRLASVTNSGSSQTFQVACQGSLK